MASRLRKIKRQHYWWTAWNRVVRSSVQKLSWIQRYEIMTYTWSGSEYMPTLNTEAFINYKKRHYRNFTWQIPHNHATFVVSRTEAKARCPTTCCHVNFHGHQSEKHLESLLPRKRKRLSKARKLTGVLEKPRFGKFPCKYNKANKQRRWMHIEQMMRGKNKTKSVADKRFKQSEDRCRKIPEISANNIYSTALVWPNESKRYANVLG